MLKVQFLTPPSLFFHKKLRHWLILPSPLPPILQGLKQEWASLRLGIQTTFQE
ncbi:MAG: DUF1435 family protein [Allomuricauda sp.]